MPRYVVRGHSRRTFRIDDAPNPAAIWKTATRNSQRSTGSPISVRDLHFYRSLETPTNPFPKRR